jgi:hypothetical protein
MIHSPSIDVFGSYFPVWMLCLVIGILLTMGCRALFIRLKVEGEIGYLAVTYPCLTVLFTCLLWLFWFR